MEENNPLRNFTLLGRLWVIARITGGMLAFIAYVSELLPTFPPGRYPLVFFVVPVVLGTLAVYALGYKIFRFCGFRMRIDQ